MSNGGSYDPQSIEPRIYKFWEEGGYFHAEPDPDREPYVIDIPLPNVTGSLHLGHALNNMIQDVLIRRARMRGKNAMWMPGTDHAGIATQAVVEKRIYEQEGKTRHDFEREDFEARIWEWKEKYGGRILEQLRRIGCSCDWPRTRFTLDEVCAKAVYEVFFQWFKDGLIYRGLRLVNWDAQLQTAVSDDEIIYETVQSNLWHYRYPILESDEVAARAPARPNVAAGPCTGRSLDKATATRAIERAARPEARLGEDYLSIATTRPETMLGDTAVAVHPDDERYKHLIGKNCILPLMDRPIPIIADGILVNPEFGTGCVKVTPGHDPNDYAFAERHGVPKINILAPNGRINENGGKYGGMTVEDARAKVVADLEALGLMEQIEPYQHEVGHSDRSKTPIEPMLSEQWFVKMADLCETAMQAVRDGRVKFFPERYAKTYLDWLGEKRDWCISRQLWWGHRISVWRRRFELTESNWTDEFLGVGMDALLEGNWGGADDLVLRAVRVRDGAIVDKPAREFMPVCGDTEGEYDFAVCLRDPADRGTVGLLEQAGFERDPDVLDTWFSSALWPFSTLGWPDNYGRGWPNQSPERKRGARSAAAGHQPPGGVDRPLARAQGSDGGADLDYFYPTSTLVTAREIITLWVARMVMTGLYFMKDVPFHHVHIHPNIQDGTGRRMSKSAGNGVDPVDLIDLYGTDAMRFTLTQMATETQDMRMPVSYLCPHCRTLIAQDSVVPKNKVPAQVQKVTCKHCRKPFATVWASDELKQELGVARDTSDRFELGRNFCNKLWQAATGFVFPNIGRAAGFSPPGATETGWPRPLDPDVLAMEDHWILSRLSACIEEVDRRFERYQLNEAANALYAFFWGEFCDWYVELVKPRLFSRNDAGEMVRHDDESARIAQQVLTWVLDQTLRLLHPIMPFVTEKLWHRLNGVAPQRGITEVVTPGKALIVASWPDASVWAGEAQGRFIDGRAILRTTTTASARAMIIVPAVQAVIRALREIRNHVNGIRSAARESAIKTLPRAVVKAEADLAKALRDHEAMIHRLGQCEALEIGPDLTRPPESISKVLSGIEVYVPLSGLADLEIERKRLKKEREELGGHTRRLEGKLANEGFVSKAPAEVVERERTRLTELREKLVAVERNIAEVGE